MLCTTQAAPFSIDQCPLNTIEDAQKALDHLNSHYRWTPVDEDIKSIIYKILSLLETVSEVDHYNVGSIYAINKSISNLAKKIRYLENNQKINLLISKIKIASLLLKIELESYSVKEQEWKVWDKSKIVEISIYNIKMHVNPGEKRIVDFFNKITKKLKSIDWKNYLRYENLIDSNFKLFKSLEKFESILSKHDYSSALLRSYFKEMIMSAKICVGTSTIIKSREEGQAVHEKVYELATGILANLPNL